MAYPKVIQQGLLDWIADRIGNDEPTPTDQEIISRFGLSGVEAARSLLADLADSGKITIKGFGANRVITLGRTKSEFTPARPVSRSIAKPLAPVEDRVEMMRRVLGATKPVDPPAPPPAPRVSPAAIRPKPDSDRGEGVQESVVPAPSPAPHPIVGMKMPRPPVTASKSPRQLSILLPGADFAKLDALAEEADVMPGRLAREHMVAWLNDTPPAAPPRSIIPASIAAAAIRDGFPVVDFAYRMMLLGLAAYAHEMTEEPTPC